MTTLLALKRESIRVQSKKEIALIYASQGITSFIMVTFLEMYATSKGNETQTWVKSHKTFNLISLFAGERSER